VGGFLKGMITRELAELSTACRFNFQFTTNNLDSHTVCQAAVDGFLEEMIIRRELADNFCFYEPNYDNLDCAAPWARESLTKHTSDKREHLYSKWA